MIFRRERILMVFRMIVIIYLVDNFWFECVGGV